MDPTETAEKIVAVLGGTEIKNGWSVLCPAHPDHEPSLDLTVKSDTLLFKCRAGCEQESVLESLRSLNLWPRERTKVGPIITPENRVASYAYVDPVTEAVIAYKDRYEAFRGGKRRKTFQWRLPSGETELPEGTDRMPLFGAENLLKYPDATVVMVEGEKVVQALTFALGVGEYVFVSPPNGAESTWTETRLDLLRGRRVVILPDEDEPGYKFLGHTLGALADVANATWVKLPGIGMKGDAADWILEHRPDDFREALATSMRQEVSEHDLPAPEGSLPHDAAAERVILGAILVKQGDAYEVVRLDVGDFYIPAHRIIFEAMTDLYAQDKPLGTNTVRDYLASRELLTQAGGIAYLMTLEREGKTHYAEYLNEQSELVRKKSASRKLITAGEKITAMAWEAKLDPQEAQTAAWEVIASAVEGSAHHGVTDMPTLMQSVRDGIEVASQRIGEFTGLPTGFYLLDRATSGLQKQDLIVLAARPSLGKTALALNIALNAAMKDASVLLFSLEMSEHQIGQRLVTLKAQVPHEHIRTGRMPTDEAKKVGRAITTLRERRIFVDDTSRTLVDMMARSKQIKREHGLDLIMVDYLQIMEASRTAQKFGQVAEVTELSKGLKRLAKDLDVPVLALSQLSRKPEERPNKRPQLSDLRDSGSVEQDADIVWGLYRDEYYHPLDSENPTDRPGIAEVEMLKHRNGPTGRYDLYFSPETMSFGTLDYASDEGAA